MDLAIGLAAGFVFGGIFAFIEHRLLISRLAKLDERGNESAADVMKIYALRYLISVLVLLCVFLTRKLVPLNYYGTLIGTALGLTLPSQIMAMRAGLNKTDYK